MNFTRQWASGHIEKMLSISALSEHVRKSLSFQKLQLAIWRDINLIDDKIIIIIYYNPSQNYAGEWYWQISRNLYSSIPSWEVKWRWEDSEVGNNSGARTDCLCIQLRTFIYLFYLFILWLITLQEAHHTPHYLHTFWLRI